MQSGVNAPESTAELVAKERVAIGPVPDWVVPCPFDIDFKARKPEQLTFLLVNQQVHAERRQVHFHAAIRLETMQAVQHQSQWRLQFEPRNQFVTLHWIRIHRAGAVVEQADLERFRFLQRAEGLEGFVIDGWYTMLLVLEDVRPGDVIESCYTIEAVPLLLPDNCAYLFDLPQNVPVGKYSFALRFDGRRPVKWKASPATLKPDETQEGDERLWVWNGERHIVPEPEPNIPEWHLAEPWIQISDCDDWRQVALAVSRVWQAAEEPAALKEIAEGLLVEQPALEGFSDPETKLLARVEKALRLIQDQYRYLSIDLEVGGHVPAPPEMVALRRFGDCKDLSFMLVHLLRLLGVPARPVLVHTRLRKSVGEMLPMPTLFNHAVVEFELQGETRWVDPTLKMQGGGPLNRFISNYGFGLPVDEESTGLIGAPTPNLEGGLYELKETILLDTRGRGSLLSVILRAKGVHADILRHEFGMKGIEEVTRERLQLLENRYPRAVRFGELKHRDDRVANEFALAEVFEVDGILQGGGRNPNCTLRLPFNLVVSTLLLPEKESRQNPFALPYPCNLVHVVEVLSPAIPAARLEAHNVNSPFIRYDCSHKNEPGSWIATYRLCTLADSVPGDRMSVYRRTIEEIRQKASFNVTLGIGHPPPARKPDGFGELPREVKPSPIPQPEVASAHGPAQPTAPPAGAAALPEGRTESHASPSRSRNHRTRHEYEYRQHHRRKWNLKRWLWGAVIGGIALVFLFLFVSAIRENSPH